VSLATDALRSESPRQYFRRHLQQQTSSVRDLRWYLDESVPRFAGSAEVRLAVEELVDRIGEFLSFGVGRLDGDDFGVWTSPHGPRLVVRVESPVRAVASLASVAHARARLLASLDVTRDEDLSSLCVLAGGGDERLLNEAVALRRSAREVRLVSVPALVALAESFEAGRLSHANVLQILRPASALADGVIAIAAGEAVRRP
jgi:hypothetical protein